MSEKMEKRDTDARFTVAVAVVTYERIRSCQPDALPRPATRTAPHPCCTMEINSTANARAHSVASSMCLQKI